MYPRRLPDPPKNVRRWLKFNIPLFLDAVVLGYLLLTFFVVGDGAIRAGNEHATVGWKRTKDPIPVGNAYGDLGFLLLNGRHFWPFDLIHSVPDMLLAFVLGTLTLVALHTAALGDPGEIPTSWTQAPASGKMGPGSPGFDVTCDPVSGTMMTPTSHTASEQQEFPKQFDSNLAPGWTHCDKCNIWRPPRSHHCRYCGFCVARYDHHCVWQDNCVGERNHKCFWLFLVYISASICHFWVMFVRFFFAENLSVIMRSLDRAQPFIFLIMYTLVVLSTTIFAFFFVCSTTCQMCSDVTTVEQTAAAFRQPGAPPRRRPRQWLDPKTHNRIYVFWYGCYRNFSEAVGSTNPLMWFVPTLGPPLKNPLLAADGQDAASPQETSQFVV